jgi:hypothetical protein
MRWPEALLSFALVVAGLVHLPPLVGLLSAARLEALYGVPVRDPALEILLRHRALMFGLLAALMFAGAFLPALRAVAIAVALLSMFGFVAVGAMVGEWPAALRKIAIADIAAGSLLLVALGLRAVVR